MTSCILTFQNPSHKGADICVLWVVKGTAFSQEILSETLSRAVSDGNMLDCRSWNANSGDTGGLGDDSWLNIQWPKADFLTVSPNSQTATKAAAPGGWGLTPWYLS